MSFEGLLDRLPRLADHQADGAPPGSPPPAWPRLGRGGASFSDDLMGTEGRLGVRVRVTDRAEGGYVVDLRDSDPPDARFGLGEDRVRTACLLALGHALGCTPAMSWASHVELLIDPSTWVGIPERDTDPAALAFGMARTADALLGALANAWPGRVGAGSCSLGAVVELSADDRVVLTEVLPGGEGGRPDRPGADAWAGLVLPSRWPEAEAAEGVAVEGRLREDSGGGGKHAGGRGVVRSYQVERDVARPLVTRVAFDRTRNPPHGIDRAGPPAPTEVRLLLPGQDRPRPVQPWERVELPAGARLEVLTCGGAGWGFPGYGDIEWDPSEWFGSKARGS